MSEAAGALVRCETDKIAWTYHLCRFVLIHLLEAAAGGAISLAARLASSGRGAIPPEGLLPPVGSFASSSEQKQRSTSWRGCAAGQIKPASKEARTRATRTRLIKSTYTSN